MYSIEDIRAILPYKVKKSGKSYITRCPFHEDDSPSFSINIEKGYFNCFGCKKSGLLDTLASELGVSAVIRSYNYDFSDEKLSCERDENKYIPEIVIDEFIDTLWKFPKLLQRIKTRIPDDETLKRYKIGYSLDYSRFTIPIYEDNLCRNIKLYSFTKKPKQLNYPGFGSPVRLYGLDIIESQRIIICAGELDKLLLRYFGFPSICGTGGENTWFDEWNYLFKDKDVYIIFDQDDAGKNSSIKIAKSLFGTAQSIKIVEFDIYKGDGFDVSNYFLDEKKTKTDFINCLKNAKVFENTYVKRKSFYSPSNKT